MALNSPLAGPLEDIIEADDLTALVESVGRRLRDLSSWRPSATYEEWREYADRLQRDIARMDWELERRGETVEIYGWTHDERGRWHRVGEDLLPTAGWLWITETAAILTDEELVMACSEYGAKFLIDNDGSLKVTDHSALPEPLKVQVRQRQKQLAGLIDHRNE